MTTLRIDIETKSKVDLKKSGVYKYVECPDFEVTLFAYKLNDEPTKCVDLLHGEVIPQNIVDAIDNINVIKIAFNAAFERTCLAKHFMRKMPANQWRCTQVQSIMLGLPMHLEGVGRALGLQIQKDARGGQLIRYFCIPRKPTKDNTDVWNDPVKNAYNWQQWQVFKEYCIRDVDAETAIANALSFFVPTDFERKVWILDQQINDRGVLINPDFIKNAIRINQLYKAKLVHEAIQLTQLANPNSRDQLITWLNEELETDEDQIQVKDVTKKSVEKILRSCTNLVVNRVLKIRQQTSKTSIKKYDKMLLGICDDNRMRGIHQYYGAGRTGRWAGRLVQPQNLPKNNEPTLDIARQIVKDNDGALLEALYGNVPDILSQLIRTAFVAPKNKLLGVSDFSAIEARMLAWLAGETWRMEVFNTHGKIYEASASQMFKVPIESVTKTSDYRFKGKVSDLSLGYQGGVGALIRMGALEMGLKEDELDGLKTAWRQANPNTVKYWADINAAVLTCVEERRPVKVGVVAFEMQGSAMFIKLPSGRNLVYINAKIGQGKYGPVVQYMGINQETKQWGRLETYGGKLVENICQAIARDCLAFAMVTLNNEGYTIVLHVHDEVVLELPEDIQEPVKKINEIMGIVPPWAHGLPLKAESFITPYYRKD